jgi:hypothetical protein
VSTAAQKVFEAALALSDEVIAVSHERRDPTDWRSRLT